MKTIPKNLIRQNGYKMIRKKDNLHTLKKRPHCSELTDLNELAEFYMITLSFRTEEEEEIDRRIYQAKGRNVKKKLNVLQSLQEE